MLPLCKKYTGAAHTVSTFHLISNLKSQNQLEYIKKSLAQTQTTGPLLLNKDTHFILLMLTSKSIGKVYI